MLRTTINRLIENNETVRAGIVAREAMTVATPDPLFYELTTNPNLETVEAPAAVQAVIFSEMTEASASSRTVRSEDGSVTLTLVRNGSDVSVIVYSGRHMIATGVTIGDGEHIDFGWAHIDEAFIETPMAIAA